MSYYNTTGLAGQPLAESIAAAANQETAILTIYRSACRPMSPSDVLAICERAGRRWPLTSIRRAITGLTGEGLLERLDLQRAGLYGKPEHLWRLAVAQRELFGVAA